VAFVGLAMPGWGVVAGVTPVAAQPATANPTTRLDGVVLDESPLQRIEAWVHRATCRQCRRFWKQVRALDRELRAALDRTEEDAPADLEERIVQRLIREKSSGRADARA